MRNFNFLSLWGTSLDNGSRMVRDSFEISPIISRKLFTLLFCLFLGFGQMWGADDYVKLFDIGAGSVVSGTSYSTHSATVETRGWLISFGGNNSSVGTNSTNRGSCNLWDDDLEKYAVSPVTTTDVASVFVNTTPISDVSKISYTYTSNNKGSNYTNVYLIYSSTGTTFAQMELTSGTQGATISSGTAFEFAKCSGYFGLLFVATNSSSDWRIDAVNLSFFKQNKLSVTYNGNGATGGNVPTDASSPYTPSSTVTVLDNTGNLVRTDCIFAGWNTQTDGEGTNYAADATFSISENTTLYAKWTATVKWIVGNTTVRTDENIVIPEAGKSVTPPEDPTTAAPNCGDKFMGWTTTNIGAVGLTDAAAISALNLFTGAKNVTGDVTFYAVFADYVEQE